MDNLEARLVGLAERLKGGRIPALTGDLAFLHEILDKNIPSALNLIRRLTETGKEPTIETMKGLLNQKRALGAAADHVEAIQRCANRGSHHADHPPDPRPPPPGPARIPRAHGLA